MKNHKTKSDRETGFSRREFLTFSGAAAVGLGLAGLPNLVWVKDGIAAIPVSGGYILVDTKKCQGCTTCMLACSLVHEGVQGYSMSRIQVVQNSFEKWPADLTIEQCRQCEEPECVEACPEDALAANPKFGYVRMVDREKCIGCGSCVEACPYTPSRPIVVEDDAHGGKKKSRKCDLCADTPYWKTEGGPNGKQACVEICPVQAIAFTKELPEQSGDSGYNVDLRDEFWGKLGYPTD